MILINWLNMEEVSALKLKHGKKEQVKKFFFINHKFSYSIWSNDCIRGDPMQQWLLYQLYFTIFYIFLSDNSNGRSLYRSANFWTPVPFSVRDLSFERAFLQAFGTCERRSERRSIELRSLRLWWVVIRSQLSEGNDPV